MNAEGQTRMTAEDVIVVVRFLEGDGISVWVHGGWGVDALLEGQTREHKDVDLILALSDVPRMRTLLAGREFELLRGGPPKNFVLADGKGLEIDCHPVTWDALGNGIYRMENGEDWPFPASGFRGRGTIFGQTVQCLTPEVQMFLSHASYELTEKDFREMEALHKRFGVEYPVRIGG